MHPDRRLRALYRLAEVAEGEQLERVRAAIAERRSQLELGAFVPSAWDALPPEVSHPETSEPPTAFTPAPADAVPVLARRPGERGFRVVGTADSRRAADSRG